MNGLVLLDERTALWHRRVTSNGLDLVISLRPLMSGLPGIAIPYGGEWSDFDDGHPTPRGIWSDMMERLYRYHDTIDRTLTDGIRRRATSALLQGGTHNKQTYLAMPCDDRGYPPRTRVYPLIPALSFIAAPDPSNTLPPLPVETYDRDEWPDPQGWWVYRLRGHQ